MSKVIDELLGNSPLVIQLQQELTTFNHLLELIHDTLSQLKLAISGEIIMSAQLEDIYHAMFIQQVPAQFKVEYIFILIIATTQNILYI